MSMETDRPEELPMPLVDGNVDLSGFSSFMLNVDRLLASELVALGTPEECWAALMLWCRAWKQKPAGSLPNDDRILASFSGAGKRWKKIKPMALRGFLLCNDGRFYHKVLAEEANTAWEKRARFKERSAKASERRWAERHASEKENKPSPEEGLPASEGPTTTILEGCNKDSYKDSYKDATRTPSGPPQGLLNGVDRDRDRDRDRDIVVNPRSKASASRTESDASPSATPPAKIAATGSRLSDDWVLPMAWGEWAMQEQPTWTPEHVRKVADGFRDYWCSKAGADARKTDWQATWRNWVRKEKPITRQAQDGRNLTVAEHNRIAVEQARVMIFGTQGATHAS